MQRATLALAASAFVLALLGATPLGSAGVRTSVSALRAPLAAAGLVSRDKTSTVRGPRGPRGPRGYRGPRGFRGPTGPKGSTGAPGAVGATGAQGATGAKGDTGAQGALGPTSGGSAGLVETIGGTGFTVQGSTTTVTLPATGKVFVTLNGFWVTGCNAAGPCSTTLSAFVDGTPVPGAHVNVNAAANASTSTYLSASGILTNVAAGQHTIALETKNSANVNVTNQENTHVDAIALGNG
jgi:hypothetical protein